MSPRDRPYRSATVETGDRFKRLDPRLQRLTVTAA